MPSPQARFANRNSLGYYRPELSIEQIIMFEYMVDIARFSPKGVFRIKKRTIETTLRLKRRKVDSVLDWLKEIKLLVELPGSKNKPKTYYFDFPLLVERPQLIFAMGIPHSPEYTWLTQRRKRLWLFTKAKRNE